jgi:hypothetical protein
VSEIQAGAAWERAEAARRAAGAPPLSGRFEVDLGLADEDQRVDVRRFFAEAAKRAGSGPGRRTAAVDVIGEIAEAARDGVVRIRVRSLGSVEQVQVARILSASQDTAGREERPWHVRQAARSVRQAWAAFSGITEEDLRRAPLGPSSRRGWIEM